MAAIICGIRASGDDARQNGTTRLEIAKVLEIPPFANYFFEQCFLDTKGHGSLFEHCCCQDLRFSIRVIRRGKVKTHTGLLGTFLRSPSFTALSCDKHAIGCALRTGLGLGDYLQLPAALFIFQFLTHSYTNVIYISHSNFRQSLNSSSVFISSLTSSPPSYRNASIF